jgi:hypothetical protein
LEIHSAGNRSPATCCERYVNACTDRETNCDTQGQVAHRRTDARAEGDADRRAPTRILWVFTFGFRRVLVLSLKHGLHSAAYESLKAFGVQVEDPR